MCQTRIRRLPSLLACLFLLGATCRADEPAPKTLYLSPTGDDQAGDGSRSHPYQTLTRALVEASNASATINLLPGEYFFSPTQMPSRGQGPSTFLVLQSASGRNSVKIRTGYYDYVLAISDDNVRIRDLRFYSAANRVLSLLAGADNTVIEDCLFDQTAAFGEDAAAISLEGDPVIPHEKVTVSGNIFIGSATAALITHYSFTTLHFIYNTVHIPMNGLGVKVVGNNYSGLIVANNIFNFTATGVDRTPIQVEGVGTGTKVELNCVSTILGTALSPVSNKLATHSLTGLLLPFRDFGEDNPDAGKSDRGNCFDVYSQEKLSVLKRP